ncbi:MAG: DUF262 domain-containing protein [Hyphomicrobiales bacterium]
MSTQIRPSVTNPTIGQLYKEIADELLKLAPDFQRRFVWTQAHQEDFLDTIIGGYPFPEIYVSKGEVDIAAMRTVRLVIDGQQRLTTIKNYIDGKSEKPLSKVAKYADLTDQQKSDFLSYEVVVRDLGQIDSTVIKEIFRRINLTKFDLDTVEIHNAIYDGAYIQTAKTILESSDLSLFGVFRESEFTRMADLHFVLLVMTTVVNGGYFNREVEVEPFVEKYNAEFPAAVGVSQKILEVFAHIQDLKLPIDSMWFRKSNFFTLVCELSMHDKPIPVDFSNRLKALEKLVMDNKLQPTTKYGTYYSYMYQGTNGRKARVTRADLFKTECLL